MMIGIHRVNRPVGCAECGGKPVEGVFQGTQTEPSRGSGAVMRQSDR